jgi:hypothetical protein
MRRPVVATIAMNASICQIVPTMELEKNGPQPLLVKAAAVKTMISTARAAVGSPLLRAIQTKKGKGKYASACMEAVEEGFPRKANQAARKTQASCTVLAATS